jgi:K+-sensing histidine kinase KdpD
MGGDDEHSKIFRFISILMGLLGGLLLGMTSKFVGGSWGALVGSAFLGCLVGKVLSPEYSASRMTTALVSAFRYGRSLPQSARTAFSAAAVALACLIALTVSEIALSTAFYLFAVPPIISTVFFGARWGRLAALLSVLALIYFVIPPPYSFRILSIRDFGYACAFAFATFIVSEILNLQCSLGNIDQQLSQYQRGATAET